MNFQIIYPFTTEDISGYLPQLNVKNKKILTVGSSADQALNALLLGAEEVTIFDLNEEKEKFYKEKKDIILNSNRADIYNKVLGLKKFNYFDDIFSKKDLEKMNLYMNSDENYRKLQEILVNSNVSFATGNIFDIKNSDLKKQNFDVILLSNVLQYLEISDDDLVEEKIYEIYLSLNKYLNKDGIIQLYYLYASIYPKAFSKIVNYFFANGIIFNKLECDNSIDSVVLVKKK